MIVYGPNVMKGYHSRTDFRYGKNEDIYGIIIYYGFDICHDD